MKVISVILLIILIGFVALDFSILNKREANSTPIPANPPLPSIVPTTDSPREIKKDVKIQYQSAKVEIKNFTAIPNLLTVKINTIVTFINFDNDPHQIVGDKWKTRPLKKGESSSQAFEKVGNFPYKDPASPQLTGIIVVE